MVGLTLDEMVMFENSYYTQFIHFALSYTSKRCSATSSRLKRHHKFKNTQHN